ncbi:MAG TPA: VOC family protein, partial [Rubrivivax sp.]|nr:VOC family protein [Rubrivivax sp.]
THVLFGTHNRLLKIATPAFPQAYLEIIAVDPAAPPQRRARWFGLDDPALQQRLAASPCLIHAVARTETLGAQRRALLAAGLDPGEPVQASRDTPQGRLAWQILVRADGRLLCGGALPTLIQWEGMHPAARMPESGLALRALTLNGVPATARELLGLRNVQVQAGLGPALGATLETPLGTVTLESP